MVTRPCITWPGATVARSVDASEPQSTVSQPEAKTRAREIESHSRVVTTRHPAVGGPEGI